PVHGSRRHPRPLWAMGTQGPFPDRIRAGERLFRSLVGTSCTGAGKGQRGSSHVKLNIRQDFTSFARAGTFLRAVEASGGPAPFDVVTLAHDERHLRRKVLELSKGEKILVDLPE